jgi:hypothetical protein
MIDDIDGKALAREVRRPALAAVRRGFVRRAGMPGAMHHDDWRPADVPRDSILHVHLLDGDGAGLRDAAHRRAGMARMGELPVDEEAAFVLQL